jgi:hypothetical protein
VEWWDISDDEVRRLRDYLLRGGFMIVDNFYGADQWNTFRNTMERVLPSRAIVGVPDADSMMHVLYDIYERSYVHPRLKTLAARCGRKTRDRAAARN